MTTGNLDLTDQFTERDQNCTYQEEDLCMIKEEAVIITEPGIYGFEGEYESIKIDCSEKEKVQLVFMGASIKNDNGPAVYVKSADKVFITLKESSENMVSDAKKYEKEFDDDKIDGAIFADCNLTINGMGQLTVEGNHKAGIVSKKNLRVTGGVIFVSAKNSAIEGKNSIRLTNADITVNCRGKGFRSGNNDNIEKGYIYIKDGTYTVIDAKEGIEGAYVVVEDGKLSITATDDGININHEEGYLEIDGGWLYIDSKGDGIDSNGDIYINGGELYIDGPVSDHDSAFDHSGKAYINGGTSVMAGSAGMVEPPEKKSGQCILSCYAEGEAEKEIIVCDNNNETVLLYKPSKRFSHFYISSPKLKLGETYTIVVGEEKTELTIKNIYTTVGENKSYNR